MILKYLLVYNIICSLIGVLFLIYRTAKGDFEKGNKKGVFLTTIETDYLGNEKKSSEELFENEGVLAESGLWVFSTNSMFLLVWGAITLLEIISTMFLGA